MASERFERVGLVNEQAERDVEASSTASMDGRGISMPRLSHQRRCVAATTTAFFGVGLVYVVLRLNGVGLNLSTKTPEPEGKSMTSAFRQVHNFVHDGTTCYQSWDCEGKRLCKDFHKGLFLVADERCQDMCHCTIDEHPDAAKATLAAIPIVTAEQQSSRDLSPNGAAAAPLYPVVTATTDGISPNTIPKVPDNKT